MFFALCAAAFEDIRVQLAGIIRHDDEHARIELIDQFLHELRVALGHNQHIDFTDERQLLIRPIFERHGEKESANAIELCHVGDLLTFLVTDTADGDASEVIFARPGNRGTLRGFFRSREQHDCILPCGFFRGFTRKDHERLVTTEAFNRLAAEGTVSEQSGGIILKKEIPAKAPRVPKEPRGPKNNGTFGPLGTVGPYFSILSISAPKLCNFRSNRS